MGFQATWQPLRWPWGRLGAFLAALDAHPGHQFAGGLVIQAPEPPAGPAVGVVFKDAIIPCTALVTTADPAAPLGR